MSDVRALLKAKRQEARVTHPLASYSEKTGQLRCIVCNIIIKHASAWDGHIGSKAHRTYRLKAEERARKEQEVNIAGKRKVEDESLSPDDAQTKKRRVEDEGLVAKGLFPEDFFSNPSLAPPDPDEVDVDEEDDEPTPPTKQPEAALDLEWEKFQQAVLSPPDQREAYERATVFAEPELASETPQGFPSQLDELTLEEVPNRMDEEQARRNKEQDERELMMDRMMDEERAQEEADMKVNVMKVRLETLKKKREAAKATKAVK